MLKPFVLQHFCSASPQRRSHIQPCAASTSEPSSKTDFRERKPEDVRVLVVGPTGYIGRYKAMHLEHSKSLAT